MGITAIAFLTNIAAAGEFDVAIVYRGLFQTSGQESCSCPKSCQSKFANKYPW